MSVISRVKNRLHNTTDIYRPPVTVRQGGLKKALIVYITSPFRRSTNIFHSNYIETIQLADMLSEAGFEVDCVDYRYRGHINYNKYDFIIGFGYPFRNSFSTSRTDIKRVCYLTGASPEFSGIAEAKRIKALYNRRNVRITSQRDVLWPWAYAAVNADAIFLIGNEWTASTYNGVNDIICTLPVPYISRKLEVPLTKIRKKGFVWFSGHGAVHKGLDLSLDALVHCDSDVSLDICGNIVKEKDFMKAYHTEIYNDPRVFFYGMIDSNGEKMKEVITRNDFVILPSCSEGTASSVITCMAYGLIPVVTKESGVHIPGLAIEIEEATPSGVASAIRFAASMSDHEIKERSEKVKQFVAENHSPEKYKASVRKAFEQSTL
jgi:hypothetical protein